MASFSNLKAEEVSTILEIVVIPLGIIMGFG